MSDLAIRCREISKRYLIGERERYRTLRDTIMDGLSAPFRTRPKRERKSVWALRDVSFDVRVGEVVGIIGRNGAGKSTLLKVLSRITEPTKGEAELRGRVGSLLEVGTGFHPELTGRDNVFLNGAILGMKKSEIARNFDEIVAFAEIPQFIDTPVKRYSSGMYMRLAFAIAAHLDTEILMVDEVLAVGDAEFQKKCLGRMNEAARGGRTVLFVSHSMPTMQRLCSRGILLEHGRIAFDGPMQQAAERYLPSDARSEYVGKADPKAPSITRATACWNEDEGIIVTIEFESPFPLQPPVFGVNINNLDAAVVWGTNSRFEPPPNLPDSMKSGTATVVIDSSGLRSDTYTLTLWVSEHHEDHCWLPDILTVTVGGADNEMWRPPRVYIGSTRLRTAWTFARHDENASSAAEIGC
jgi:lipopolysaccharide transport system ATP-binding protein